MHVHVHTAHNNPKMGPRARYSRPRFTFHKKLEGNWGKYMDFDPKMHHFGPKSWEMRCQMWVTTTPEGPYVLVGA